MPVLRKRSINLSGHATSLALEQPFWDALTAMAAERSLSMTAIIGEIDQHRGESALASACRVTALHWALTGHPSDNNS